MSPWLIFGAGGSGVGALMLAHALNERRPVYAVIRKPDVAERLTQQGVTVFTGDACNTELVTLACEAAGANATILSSIGGTQEYLAHRTVIDAAEKAGLSRMILVTSLGCGDSWRWLSPRARSGIWSVGSREIAGRKLAANQHARLRHPSPRRPVDGRRDR
jgi:NmrA-like family.